MPSIRLDNLQFKKIFDDYQVILGKTMPECVRINARLVAVELARRTQPFGIDQKPGETAVQNDVKKLLKLPIQLHQKITSERLKKQIRKDVAAADWAAVRATMVASHWAADFQFLNGASDIKPMHQKYRNNRGRVKKSDRDIFSAASSDIFTYIESIKARVGISKAGWAACAKELKTGKGSGTRGIPTWVTRHLSKRINGEVRDNTDNQVHPHVFLTNTVPWVDQVISSFQQTEALSVVGAKMKKQMEMILKKRKTQLAEAA
jgi:hypothetical protein